MNNADTVYNTLKRCLKKKIPWIYIRTWFRLFPREREKERERMRERERDAKLAHSLCFDAFVDVFVNEEFKIS